MRVKVFVSCAFSPPRTLTDRHENYHFQYTLGSLKRPFLRCPLGTRVITLETQRRTLREEERRNARTKCFLFVC